MFGYMYLVPFPCKCQIGANIVKLDNRRTGSRYPVFEPHWRQNTVYVDCLRSFLSKNFFGSFIYYLAQTECTKEVGVLLNLY